jgi:hypothetical protein
MQMPGLSTVEKLGLAVGSASLTVAPMAASAALVTVNPTPGLLKISVTDPDNTAVAWDVDGTGAAEFALEVRKSASSGPNFQFAGTFLFLNSQGLNGRGIVGQLATDDAANVLPTSFDVGQTLASPYVFGLSNASDRRVIRKTTFQSNYGAPFTSSTVAIDDIDLSPGANFVGFRFDAGSGLQYGWAEILLDLTAGSESIEISRWTYDDAPGSGVHVADEASAAIPLPASILPALTLLGMGAAGMRSWRRRQAKIAGDSLA